MANHPKSNIRYRVSEQVAAELNHAFRQSGHRSWDEFFSALLARQTGNPERPVETVIRQETRLIRDDVSQLLDRTGHYNLLLEEMVNSLHALEIEQKQLGGHVQRLVGFLQLAFELAGDQIHESPENDDQSPEEAIFRKIRNRQLP